MRRIKLTQGRFALVDDTDFESASRFKWYVGSKGYVQTCVHLGRIGGKKLNASMYLHQLILHPPPGMEVDHRHHDTLDCRRANMRICTHAENIQNQRTCRGGTSKFKGVCWDKQNAKWRADIRHNGKQIFLGRFKDEVAAARAYDAAARTLFGDFALLNFPEKALNNFTATNTVSKSMFEMLNNPKEEREGHTNEHGPEKNRKPRRPGRTAEESPDGRPIYRSVYGRAVLDASGR